MTPPLRMLTLALALAALVAVPPAWSIDEQLILTASDGAPLDNFGYAVDMDGTTAVIGAPYAVVGGNPVQGAAYVFERATDGTWTEVAKLTASDGAEYDLFGWDVAIAGDRIVVGAEESAVGGNSSQGAAYVFERDQGGPGAWGEVKKLIEPDTIGNFAEYGHSVDIDGDVIVIGSPKAMSSANGRAYVYYRDEGGPDNWGRVVELEDDVFDSNASFGTEVSLDGDLLAISAEQLDLVPGSFENEGGVYVFLRNEGGADAWGQVARLYGSTVTPNDHCAAVSLDGTTLVAGARNAEGADFAEGRAWVFTSPDGSADSWMEVAELTASDAVGAQYFGVALALHDGTVVIGAEGHDDSRGKAYRYDADEGGAGSWGEVEPYTASDAAENHGFGWSIHVDGELLLIGAPRNGAGAVYVFDGPGGAVAAPDGPPVAAAFVALGQNHPNPFNPRTTIELRLAVAGHVELAVFDAVGRRVATLVDGFRAAGAYRVDWEAADLPSGVYLYRAATAHGVATGRAVLAK